MKKLKVMTVIGTRPEIIRLSSVIKKLDISKSIEHVLVHTGQNYDYELNEIFFKDFQLRKPDYFLESAGYNALETIGNILKAINTVLLKEKPDAFLVLGDTNSCLSAIAAKKHHVPIFHMEAGNRCFDQRVPEETNRKIVDHISDINLTYSKIAREYLINEGFPADRIIKIGSPMYEVLMRNIDDINSSGILSELDLSPKNYFLVSAHREENVNSLNLFKLADSLNLIADKYKLPIIVSTHPRTMNILKEKNINLHENIKLLKPLGFKDYNKLQIESKAVISDSGTISEESSILKFKAINIRETHERPEAMEEASVIMTGLSSESILRALQVLEDFPQPSNDVNDYQFDYVSDKVLKIILSYTEYVNRVVWFK